MKTLDKVGSLKKIVALMLVTVMVVGILSSAAVKVVAATYYMQTKRKLKVSNPYVQQAIDTIVGDNNIAGPDTTDPSVPAPEAPTDTPTETPPVEEPSTDAPADETPSNQDSQTPSGDSGSGNTNPTTPSGDGGSGGGDILGTITGLLGGIDFGGIIDSVGGMLGGLGGGSDEETTEPSEPTTESQESIENKQDVLKKYNAVVNYAKTVGKPAFTKVTYRTLDKSFTDSILFHSLQSANSDYFISKENAEANPIVVPSNTATSELLINNEFYAGMLATADAADAIESATSVKLEDGTQKITITLREEADPAVTAPDAKKAASFTSAMFPVITAEEFGNMVSNGLKLTSLKSSNVTYKNCTVELIFNPVLNRIVSIKQTTSYVGSVKGLILPSKGTITEVSEYKDFDYGLI